MTEQKTFKIKDPMYSEEIPKYVPVTCKVVDEDYAVECKVEEVTVRITPIRVRITREPPMTLRKTLSVDGRIWGDSEMVHLTRLEKVDVEWLR